MQDRIINEILTLKRKNLNELLALTESPIEKLFFAHILRYLEKSLIFNELKSNRPDINGFSYLTKSDYHDISSFGKIIGLVVDYSTTGFNIDLPNEIKVRNQKGEIELIDIKPKNKNPQSRNVYHLESTDGQEFTVMQKLHIIPQYVTLINENNYRLDFAFLLYENVNHIQTLVKKIAVECDGYEYHSGKEQFKKDRERQRNLSYDNWTIIHFSGSEINGRIGYDETHFEKEMLGILQLLGFSTTVGN